MNYDKLARTSLEPALTPHHGATMERLALGFDGWRDTCVITTNTAVHALRLSALAFEKQHGWEQQSAEQIAVGIGFLPRAEVAAHVHDPQALVLSAGEYQQYIIDEKALPLRIQRNGKLVDAWVLLRYRPLSVAEGMGWQSAKQRVARIPL